MAEPNTSRLTETLDLLTHPYRRYTLYCLTNESKVISVDSLATAVANWAEEQTRPGQNTDRNAVKTALYHTHLPKLADRGLVSFRSDTGTVELRDTDGIDQFLADTAPIDGYIQAAVGD
ncbi:ArsR family transcriptional regulator [Halobacteria archaeon AArc-curdl1]|uniref:ArsR family transcriptional regulator n=1 Tax=Natronosalvus hydrolyticus TaxID=2979988 RepID=A0AAP2Z9P2_9EURY|nr:ArsR family transcriptional regulator [Halobacteria archaeon AArc-curdl1]